MSAIAHVINQASGVSATSSGATSITVTADTVGIGNTVVVAGSLKTDGHFTVTDTGANEATSTGVGEVIEPVGSDFEFVAQIQSNVAAGTKVKDIRFNFNRSSERYIRNVFNTDPTLTNTSITPTQDQEIYWLGETFERHVKILYQIPHKHQFLVSFFLWLMQPLINGVTTKKHLLTLTQDGSSLKITEPTQILLMMHQV